MKKIIRYYSKNTAIFEFFITLLLFFIVLTFSYFLFLQSTIILLRTDQKQNALIYHFYQKKCALRIDNTNIVRQLKSWQQKHPRFYNAMLAMHTSHDAMQSLTKLIQRAHFSITHIITNHKTQLITIKSTGQFSNLFLLFSALNHDPLPMTVAQFNIATPDKFTFKFQMSRGSHAQH